MKLVPASNQTTTIEEYEVSGTMQKIQRVESPLFCLRPLTAYSHRSELGAALSPAYGGPPG